MRPIGVAIVLLSLFLVRGAWAQITDYGPFRYSPQLPGVLVMTGDIKPFTATVMRRALDNHPDIETVFLASPGGSVLTGLEMSAIIRDRGLNTVVPPRASCASACTFLFVAGKKRRVYGRLGVHQFSSRGAVQGAEAEETAQSLMAQILDRLNAYKVSQYFIVKMLETPHNDIYWFTTQELRAHGIETFATFPREISQYEAVPELARRGRVGTPATLTPRTTPTAPATTRPSTQAPKTPTRTPGTKAPNSIELTRETTGSPLPQSTPATPAPTTRTSPPPAPSAPATPAPQRLARPSFDCDAARTETEKFLCLDPELADLDRLMAQRYKDARASRAFAQEQALINAQRAWLRRRDRCGANKDCLSKLYAQRIRELAN